MTKELFEKFFKYLQSQIKGTTYENHVFFVGGCVRDFLMGNPIHDIDIAVDLPRGGIVFAEWLTQKEKCYKMNSNPVIFPKYGTAKFNLSSSSEFNDIIIECVQTIKNPRYSLNDCSPMVDNFGTILDDAHLRDLTINSMYIDISEGQLLDPTNGIDDIDEHILKTTNIPDVIFKDDPLRMLRVIRFASKYQWNIEQKTWLGIVKNHEKIKEVSVERIREEINNILLTDKPSCGLKRLLNSGILYDIIPQLYALNHTKQNNRTIWEHTMAVVDNSSPSLINRITALFHDIGKQLCEKYINGKQHFYGHECCGATLATEVMKTFKYPDQVIKEVENAIRLHMRFSMCQGNYVPTDKTLRKFLVDVGENKELVLDIIRSDFESYGYNRLANYYMIEEALEKLDSNESLSKLKLPIDGTDIMTELNLKGGPLIGSMLNKVKEGMIEKPNLSKEEALDICRKILFATV